MKLCSPLLAATAISSAILLVSCGGGTFYSYNNVTLVISPRIATIAVNGTQTFTATVTNAPPTPVWSVLFGSGVPTDSSYSGSFVTATETSPTESIRSGEPADLHDRPVHGSIPGHRHCACHR